MELNITTETEQKINQKYNHYVYKRKNLKILIIDDDESVSSILQDYLELRGHQVETVNEGTRGMSKNNIRNYDIIFIDYHLDNDLPPNINKENLDEENILTGANVSEIINLTKENKNKTLIFGYTGDSSREAIRKFKNSGADGVLFKPAEPELIDKLMFNIESSIEFDNIQFIKAFKSLKQSIIIF
jgi:CheY-like chemotaxis protein